MSTEEKIEEIATPAAMEAELKEAQKAVVEDKLSIGKEKKAAADELFKTGETKKALGSYHTALLFIQGLDKSVLGAVSGASGSADAKEKKTEADILIETIYSNMAACHIKNENWRRAEECANQKNPDNKKASFRKAKALAGQGFTEKAIKLLEELATKNPTDASIKVELKDVRAKDKALSAKGLSKFKGFLSKEKSPLSEGASVEEVSSHLEASRIEEVP